MAPRRPATALLSKYLEQYRRQPASRVFAPLAEAYRKLGMLDEALQVLRDGLRRHPNYVLGYLVLAQCYADQRKHEAAYQTLMPLAPKNLDNHSLQRLFAQTCLELGYLDEALETFKYLLFLNPRDPFYAEKVRTLEDDLQRRTIIKPQSALKKAPGHTPVSESLEEDWAMVDFAGRDTAPAASTDEDQWTMRTTVPQEQRAPQPSLPDEWKIMERSIDDDFFSDEEVEPEDAEAPVAADAAPLASHTLVDLYLAQNHLAPAIDLLESFLQQNPNDQRSRARLAELRGQPSPAVERLPDAEAESGHDVLMRMIEEEVHAPLGQKMERAYRLFLQHIQLTADEKRGHG